MNDKGNVFMGANGEPTDEAKWFVGGLMAHAKALCAVAGPTVNSYKRILAGFNAPDTITWDDKGEKALIVIDTEPGDVKVELRFPDGTSNPYLLFAACMAAGLDGIKNRTAPGVKYGQDSRAYPLQRFRLPEDLKEALGELAKDEVITQALGKEFTETYIKIKRDEWRDFMSCVTQWELDNYLTRV